MGKAKSLNIFNCQKWKQQCFLPLPYLYMIYKSFILNLNLIDLADLRMHPLLGVCPALEQYVCERRYRDRLCLAIGRAAFWGGGELDNSHARGQTGVKWEDRPAELPWPMHCAHQCSCCQLSGVFARGGTVGRGQGSGCVDRKEHACVWAWGKWRGMRWGVLEFGGIWLSYPRKRACSTHMQVTCLTCCSEETFESIFSNNYDNKVLNVQNSQQSLYICNIGKFYSYSQHWWQIFGSFLY